MEQARKGASTTGDEKSTARKRSSKGTERGKDSSFCNACGVIYLKNLGLEQKLQKHKGRAVLRGDVVEDDSGSYAVFTEQGSSASLKAAAKVLDVIARLLGWAGQASDAESACAQDKMEDAPALLKLPKLKCSAIGIRLPRHQLQKTWQNIQDLVVPLDRNLYGHPLAGSLQEKQFEKALLENGCENARLGMLVLFRGKRSPFFPCMLTASRW